MDQFNLFEQDVAGLSADEAAVWKAIRQREGRENAIKVDQVAWATRLDGTKVREIVSRLVVRHSKLIASSTSHPPGFYIITDEDELRKHIASLRHRGIMCLVRAAALSKTSIEEIFRQGRLDVDGM